MRNPNGYGTVARLSGKRRKPFVVRKTRGWDERGYPIYDTIGYFATREEGMLALAEYNRNPYDIQAARITMAELYEMWVEKKLPRLGPSLRNNLAAAFKHCARIHNMKYRDIRSYHMQDCVDQCGRGYSTQGSIKNLFGHLDRYAMELDVIQKAYSSLITTDAVPETSKRPFTDAEIEALWRIQDRPWVDTVLILLYSGWRITELLILKTEDVDLEAGTMKGGIKTKNGRGRIVPIHPLIRPFIEHRLNSSNEFLIVDDAGIPMTDKRYREQFSRVMKAAGLKHCPHECRHTLRSKLDSAGANKKCIDLILGHKSQDVGERIYTHKTVEELKHAIELITR